MVVMLRVVGLHAKVSEQFKAAWDSRNMKLLNDLLSKVRREGGWLAADGKVGFSIQWFHCQVYDDGSVDGFCFPDRSGGSTGRCFQEAGDQMEPFEVMEDGKAIMLKVGGDKILQFLKQVFDVQPPESNEAPNIEKAFVIDLHEPRFFPSRSDALRLVRGAV